MEIKLYSTPEIPSNLWESIVKGFNSCFPEHQKAKKDLLEKYTSNLFGTSYHVVCEDNGIVVGFIEATPYKYLYEDKEIIAALTGDIFILKDHRQDIMLFAKLYKELKQYCESKNIVCFFGVANENAYLYSVKVLRCKDVQTMDYWILPVRISHIVKKRWLRSLDICTRLYSELTLLCSNLFAGVSNGYAIDYTCKLADDRDFQKARLSSDKYHNIVKENLSFTYTITFDEGIKCAYIMRFDENGMRTKKALNHCVGHILHNESVDMIMYNGTLGLSQTLLIKTPKRFEPRTLHVTVNYINKELEKEFSGILSKNGLDFNLLNLDVR